LSIRVKDIQPATDGRQRVWVVEAGLQIMSATMIRDAEGRMEPKRAVILYDRLETMLVANRLGLYGRSVAGEAAEWTVNTWRFDMLAWGREGERALEETAAARLMIVAAGDAPALQDWPADWLWRWAAGRTVAEAALGLVLAGAANVPAAEPAIIAPLCRLAELRGLPMVLIDDTKAGPGGEAAFRHPGSVAPEYSGNPLERLEAGAIRLGPWRSQLSKRMSTVQPGADCAGGVGRTRVAL
jgi:hypothetical protein